MLPRKACWWAQLCRRTWAFGGVKIPWMLLTGTKDSNPINGADAKTRLVVFPDLSPGSKYQLVLDKAEHSAFGDRALPGETERRNPNHHRAILAVTTAFWDASPRNDEQARQRLGSDAVRSVLEKDDQWQKNEALRHSTTARFGFVSLHKGKFVIRKRMISRFSLAAAFTCLAFTLLVNAQQKGRLTESPQQADKDGDGKLSPGDNTRTLRVGELERRYRIYIPKKYDATEATPVIVVFHGGGGNPEGMIRLTSMNAKADEAGFIVVYPYGTGKLANTLLTFNGGECCGYAMQNNIDDVGFTRELLDDLATVANVDADRVFATGLSNGGIMSHYVASELSDRIAAIAPVGGPLMMEAPRNKRPVPVMHFHGTKDEFAPFKGGFGKGFLGRNGITKFRSVDHTIQRWVQANGCMNDPEITPLPDKADDGMKVNRKTWSGGREESEVVLIEIEGGGHTWPGQKPIVSSLGESTMDISANDLMWEFFQKHPRPTINATKQETRQ